MPLRLLAAAILLASAASLGFVAYNGLRPAPVSAAAPPQMVRVLVANGPLPAGTLLKEEDVRERSFSPADLPPNALLASEETRGSLRGAMVRRYVESGDFVSIEDVLRPRDRGFLAAVLRPGTRAVAIGVDAQTGAAGLIFPGDLVDVILTQVFGAADTPAGRRVVAETVLASVRVIAVDQQMTQGPSAAPSGNRASQAARTVTLELNAEQAERVAVADRLGRLTLALRAIDAPGQEEAPRPTNTVFGSDVSPALSHSATPLVPRMRVIQGETVNELVFR
jgi:pilus assembly protein CpaB